MEITIAIIVYVVLAIVVGVVADNIGRSGFGFGLLALLMSPILALLILAVIGRSEKSIMLSEYTKEGIRRGLSYEDAQVDAKKRLAGVNPYPTTDATDTKGDEPSTFILLVAFVSIIIFIVYMRFCV
ncbi:MAG: hypothetical protein ACI35T_02240 [Alistipes sp.]